MIESRSANFSSSTTSLSRVTLLSHTEQEQPALVGLRPPFSPDPEDGDMRKPWAVHLLTQLTAFVARLQASIRRQPVIEMTLSTTLDL